MHNVPPFQEAAYLINTEGRIIYFSSKLELAGLIHSWDLLSPSPYDDKLVPKFGNDFGKLIKIINPENYQEIHRYRENPGYIGRTASGGIVTVEEIKAIISTGKYVLPYQHKKKFFIPTPRQFRKGAVHSTGKRSAGVHWARKTRLHQERRWADAHLEDLNEINWRKPIARQRAILIVYDRPPVLRLKNWKKYRNKQYKAAK